MNLKTSHTKYGDHAERVGSAGRPTASSGSKSGSAGGDTATNNRREKIPDATCGLVFIPRQRSQDALILNLLRHEYRHMRVLQMFEIDTGSL